MEQPCSGDRISPFNIDAVNSSNSLLSDNNNSKEAHINKNLRNTMNMHGADKSRARRNKWKRDTKGQL